MPLRRSSFGYRDLRVRPSVNFYVEIRAAGYCLTLVTFKTAYEVTHAYDSATWRLGRPCCDLNFNDVNSIA
jgi:hypothetical protein